MSHHRPRVEIPQPVEAQHGQCRGPGGAEGGGRGGRRQGGGGGRRGEGNEATAGKEEAVVGGVDPEALVKIEITETVPKASSRAIAINKRTKMAERISFNKIKVTETLFDKKGNPETVKSSVWEISSDGEVTRLPE